MALISVTHINLVAPSTKCNLTYEAQDAASPNANEQSFLNANPTFGKFRHPLRENLPIAIHSLGCPVLLQTPCNSPSASRPHTLPTLAATSGPQISIIELRIFPKLGDLLNPVPPTVLIYTLTLSQKRRDPPLADCRQAQRLSL